SAPKFLSYVDDARETNIRVEIKNLEDIVTTYSRKRVELPKLDEEVYASEDIKDLSVKIYDNTGVVEEVLEGSYYNIDYSKIKNYIKEPKNSSNYILHSSGKVYYFGKNGVGKGTTKDNQE